MTPGETVEMVTAATKPPSAEARRSMQRLARRIARTDAWRERQTLGTALNEIVDAAQAANEALDLRHWSDVAKMLVEVTAFARTLEAALQKRNSPSAKAHLPAPAETVERKKTNL